VRELETRLSELADVYGARSALPFTSTSLSRDFRELYLLSPEEIPDLLASDGDQPRRDDRVVQRLRKRMCYEFNFATSSLYRPAGTWPAPGWCTGTSPAAAARAAGLGAVHRPVPVLRLRGRPARRDDARARFAAKAPHEVGATTGALGRLEARLSEICGWSSSRRP
jgi:hypothetical protein